MVSIIVPTYNRCGFLLETINAIFSQGYKNFELIVVSDGSTDNTKEEMAKISDPRLTFIELEKNYGYPAAARNRGLSIAKGEYIAFCDDDDLWVEGKLEKQMKLMEQGVDFVFTNTTFVGKEVSDGSSMKSKLVNLIYNKMPAWVSYSALHIASWIPNSSVLVSKQLLGDRRFSEDKRYRASEDYELWLNILKGAKVAYLPEALLKYRLHDDNISANIGANLKRCALIFKERRVKGIGYRLLNFMGYCSYSIRFRIVK